jgi:DNA-binding transcriptional MerR regulator
VSQEDLDQQVDDAVSVAAPKAARPRARALNRPASVDAGRQEARVGVPASLPAVVLPPIPAKRYFTIGEVSDLCGVKPYVLRYWEQEFQQLRPMKRRGNRRYYQHHEVLLVRRIRELLYEQGFTISGARNQLLDAVTAVSASASVLAPAVPQLPVADRALVREVAQAVAPGAVSEPLPQWLGIDIARLATQNPAAIEALRAELLAIRDILG